MSVPRGKSSKPRGFGGLNLQGPRYPYPISPPGSTPNSVQNGTGPPAVGSGVSSQFYVDTAAGVLYVNSNGTWIQVGGSLGIVLTFDETVTAPAVVNIKSNGHVQNANGSVFGKEAHGFCKTTTNNGASGTVLFSGTLTGLAGLTPGFAYLGLTPGAVSSTPNTAGGQTDQIVGVAYLATAIVFQPKSSTQISL